MNNLVIVLVEVSLKCDMLSWVLVEGEKKARQFDFMAMFEEARKTAIDRTADFAKTDGRLSLYLHLGT